MRHDCAFLRDVGLADDQVSFAAAERGEYATDYGTPEREGVTPDAVVWPEHTGDVAAVLAAADERGVPVTPYAAGSSFAGNPIPEAGGVSLSMERMDSVVEFRPDDMQIDVQPGVVGGDVTDHVAAEELFFPAFPQSAAFSTVGGMIANDASGIRTVKYGELREWVLALEVVLADGTVVEVGSRARKTSAGYNLVDLFVGSEGTLGVVTRATLDLAPKPPETVGGRAVFPTLDDASAAIAEAVRAGVDVATIELVDALTAEIATAYTGTELTRAPMVFFEVHGRAPEADVAALEDVFEDHGVERFESSSDDAAMADLWRARREVGHALGEWQPDRDLVVVGDVTVPPSQYVPMVSTIRSLADEWGIPCPTFGHAGDGNVHYGILVDGDDPAAVERAEALSEAIVTAAIDRGGTCTGEHGVGSHKRRFMRQEFGAATLDLMGAVKDALDPNGILNPGKILPERESGD